MPAFVNSLSIFIYFASIKVKLRSGETIVAGDHWPVFLYQGYVYDPEDPWKGLFRSAVLVSVRIPFFLAFANTHLTSIFARLSNTYSHRPVQSIANPRPHALETHASMR